MSTHTHDGVSHAAYRQGTGPGVIVVGVDAVLSFFADNLR